MGGGLDLAQQALQRSSLVEYAGELADSDALLLHRVAVTQGDGTILHRLVVDGDAVGRTDSVLTSVALTDRVLLIELAVEVELQLIVDLLCLGIEAVLTYQGQDSELDRSESCGQAKDCALVTTSRVPLRRSRR